MALWVWFCLLSLQNTTPLPGVSGHSSLGRGTHPPWCISCRCHVAGHVTIPLTVEHFVVDEDFPSIADKLSLLSPGEFLSLCIMFAVFKCGTLLRRTISCDIVSKSYKRENSLWCIVSRLCFVGVEYCPVTFVFKT